MPLPLLVPVVGSVVTWLGASYVASQVTDTSRAWNDLDGVGNPVISTDDGGLSSAEVATNWAILLAFIGAGYYIYRKVK